MFEFHPRRSTPETVARAIAEWTESWRSGGPVRCWAIIDVATDALVGGVELSPCEHDIAALAPEDRAVNLSYWVAPAWRGRGIATRACELALQYAATAMGAKRAVIKVLDINGASLVVAGRLGQRVGTMPSDAGGTFVVFHRALDRESSAAPRR